MKIAVPKLADGCSPAVTTRSCLVCARNLIWGGHFPMGGVLYIERHEDRTEQDNRQSEPGDKV